MLPPEAVRLTLFVNMIDGADGNTDTVGKDRTVAALIGSDWGVALVLLALTLPLAPLTASDFNRIYTVVADTEVPLLATVTVAPYPDPLLNDTS